MKNLKKKLLNWLLSGVQQADAVELISQLRVKAARVVTGRDAKEAMLLEPVMDEQGTPLTLKYLGQERQMYRYKNENDGKIARLMWLKFFEMEKDVNVTRATLNQYIDKTLEAINKGKAAEAGSAMLMLRDTINHTTPMEVLYNQAAILFVDDEEPLDRYDADRNAAKIDAMKAHPDQGFFFSMLLKQLGYSGAEPLEDILSSLKRDAVKLKAYKRVLDDLTG